MRCLGRIVERGDALGGVCLITADHGNAEQMLDADGVSPQTAHTTNPVPCILTCPGELAAGRRDSRIWRRRCSALLGIEQPEAMTGKPLVKPL